MLNSRDRVLRYLALLLGLDEPTATHAQDAEHEGITSAINAVAGDGPRRPSPPIVLFEPLVRAAGNDIDRILSVRKQVEAVLELPKADELIPPDFLKLWDTVLKFSLSRSTP